MTVRALDGVRVVDASRILAGPFAAQLLADLGASVIKVEPPAGDATRAWGPPFERGDAGESAYYRAANRGKTAEFLDLRHERGRERLDQLLAGADVLLENFLGPAAEGLGLTFAHLHPRFPRLTVASIRAFAADTEAAARPGYDFLLQAESGWMSITGEPGGRPMKVGVALVDVLAGLYLANGIQAALLARTASGRGAHVEVALMDAALAGLVNVGAGVLMSGLPAGRYGNAHPNIVPYQSFACADGEVAVAVGNDAQFRSLVEALGLGAAFAAKPEWSTNPGRVRDRDALIAALGAAIAPLARGEVLSRCAAAGVAAGPVRSVSEALLGEQGRLHRSVVELADPLAPGGVVQVVASPLRIDGIRAVNPLAPPRRGPA